LVCREARRAARGGVGDAEEEEGIRVVAAPGPGSGAYERRVEWWRALEKKAMEQGAGRHEPEP